MTEDPSQQENEIASQEQQESEAPDGLAAAKKAADFALGEVLDALREVAREKGGGRLTFSDIKYQFDAFTEEPNADMVTAYADAWKACSQTAKAAAWQKERKYPLERLVVRRFEHLFPDRGMPAIQGEHLSRRIIGPFMFALQQLLGPNYTKNMKTDAGFSLPSCEQHTEKCSAGKWWTTIKMPTKSQTMSWYMPVVISPT